MLGRPLPAAGRKSGQEARPPRAPARARHYVSRLPNDQRWAVPDGETPLNRNDGEPS